MPPEMERTKASDVFSVAVTLFDLLWCDSAPDRLPTVPGRLPPLDIDAMTQILQSGAGLQGVGGEVDAGAHGAEAAVAMLLSRMLSRNPQERPVAADAAKELQRCLRQMQLKACLVGAACVGQDLMPEDGIQCSEGHFVCSECFSMDVEIRQVTECIRPGALHVSCCVGLCNSPPFTHRQIAQHVSATAFEALQDRIQQVHHELREVEFQEDLAKREAELLRKSVSEIELLKTRRHIENEIMVLRCPNPQCRLVFTDFNNCAALVCAAEDPSGTKRGGCGCHFCAFCFQDCGADAHEHVANCGLNIYGSVFVEKAVWREVMNDRRKALLQEFWASLDRKIQQEASQDLSVRQSFQDLGLQGLLLEQCGSESQVAQLVGLGWTDEDAVRRALNEANGNLQLAQQILQDPTDNPALLPWITPSERLGDGVFRRRVNDPGSLECRDLREFNHASHQFRKLCGQDKTPIQIDIYDNRILSAAFHAKRAEFTESGRPADEIWVFHGTKQQNIEPIMQTGFKVGGVDVGVPVVNGAMHGNGVYTALGPNTPMGYGNCNRVILARAVPGRDGAQGHSDSWRPSGDWIIFARGQQLLPQYVVHYE
eukprot:TRINITY_DN29367_c0_g1_i1.p1 TRINITY_DN29367_c0_g1~~TRINITY_DN29367_c0_g1_i1.p1  ORF type:complete len:597 (+),score=99.06 TRINITY_DN29367_c0_g1_i1:199-1989(+)